MGFFKTIIADSRQPVRSAGAGNPFADHGQSASEPAAAGLPEVACVEVTTDPNSAIRRAVSDSGAAGNAQRSAVAAAQHRSATPQVPSINRASDPLASTPVVNAATTELNSSPAATAYSGVEQSPSQSSTVFPAVESASLPEATDTAGVIGAGSPTYPTPGRPDAVTTSVLAADTVGLGGNPGVAQQHSDGGVDQVNSLLPPVFEAAGESAQTTVEATELRRKSTTAAATDPAVSHASHRERSLAESKVPAEHSSPSAAVGSDAGGGEQVYAAADVVMAARSTPGGHTPSAAVESVGERHQPSGQPGAFQPSISPSEARAVQSGSAAQPGQVHQAEVNHRGVDGKALSAQMIESAVEQGRRSVSSSVAKPPQVRIGQVNVIVEAPAAPARQSPSTVTEDLSSRLFLRSL